MLAAAKHHHSYRTSPERSNPHINISLPQPQIWITSNGTNPKEASYEYHSSLERENAPSQLLISEMMIIAGRTAALFCRERSIPIPYRIQRANPLWTADDLARFSKQANTLNSGDIFNTLCNTDTISSTMSNTDTMPNPNTPHNTSTSTLSSTMSNPNTSTSSDIVDAIEYTRTAIPAEYTPNPTATECHISMGLDCYTKVTSPIRRYPDQLVHQQIKSHLTTGKTRTQKEISKCIAYINERELRTKWLQRHSTRYWVLHLLKWHHLPVAKPLNATVVSWDETLRCWHLFLDRFNILLVYRKDWYSVELAVGMRVELLLEEIEPIRNYVQFSITKRHL